MANINIHLQGGPLEGGPLEVRLDQYRHFVTLTFTLRGAGDRVQIYLPAVADAKAVLADMAAAIDAVSQVAISEEVK
jgi:hypothetical protein